MKHWDIWDTRMNIRAATVDGSLPEALRLARAKNQTAREPGRYSVRESTDKAWGAAVLSAGPL